MRGVRVKRVSHSWRFLDRAGEAFDKFYPSLPFWQNPPHVLAGVLARQMRDWPHVQLHPPQVLGVRITQVLHSCWSCNMFHVKC